MNLAKRRAFDREILFIITLTAVFIAASTKKEHNGDLNFNGDFAEAGRIEEPPLRERNSGKYKWSLEKTQYLRSLYP